MGKVTETQCFLAMVLGQNNKPLGNTFLYRKDEDKAYWFTCHHVIAMATTLKIGIPDESSDSLDCEKASYEVGLSDPKRDVAVLSTPAQWIGGVFSPLPMGDPILKLRKYRLPTPVDINGRFLEPIEKQALPLGRDFHAKLTEGAMVVPAHSEKEKDTIKRLDNPWNLPIDGQRFNGFLLSSCRPRICLGWSGSPIFFNNFCIGMLNARVTEDKKRGNNPSGNTATAISFRELCAVTRNHIPFEVYADCVVVPLAATRAEMEQALKDGCSPLPVDEPTSSDWLNAYDVASRAAWKPFKTGESLESLLEKFAASSKYTCQLAPDTECGREWMLGDYIPLIIVVDSLSLRVHQLSEAVKAADGQHYKACYFMPICRERFHATDIKDRLEEWLRTDLNSVHMRLRSKRTLKCTSAGEFRDNWCELLDTAVETFFTMFDADVLAKPKLYEAGFPELERRIEQPRLYGQVRSAR